jgi:diadenosine tetraphosphate (Ap4A) HIT family hydrolase
MLTTPSADCPFCSLPLARVIDSDAMAVAVHDAFPVAPGHTLVIPLRHVGSFFELHESEQLAMLALLNRARVRLGADAADCHLFDAASGKALAHGLLP